MQQLLDKDKQISLRYLKTKLAEHYGDRVIITASHNNTPIICLKNFGYSVITENFNREKKLPEKKDPEEEKLGIIEKAAELINQDIVKKIYDNSSYLNSHEFLNDIENLIPLSLKCFLEKILKSRNQNKAKQLKKNKWLLRMQLSLL